MVYLRRCGFVSRLKAKMKKFRRVLDGLTTSSPGGGAALVSGGPSTPNAAGAPRDIQVQETLVSENFHVCKTSTGRLLLHVENRISTGSLNLSRLELQSL
ncbi:syntaxin-binding protein 5-like isoform X1 [Arapaima gigas]